MIPAMDRSRAPPTTDFLICFISSPRHRVDYTIWRKKEKYAGNGGELSGGIGRPCLTHPVFSPHKLMKEGVFNQMLR